MNVLSVVQELSMTENKCQEQNCLARRLQEQRPQPLKVLGSRPVEVGQFPRSSTLGNLLALYEDRKPSVRL